MRARFAILVDRDLQWTFSPDAQSAAADIERERAGPVSVEARLSQAGKLVSIRDVA